MTSSIIIIRKTWTHMGVHSGSDLLFEHLSKINDVKNIYVNYIQIPKKGILRRFLEKFGFITRENLWSFKLTSINSIKEIYAFHLAIHELLKDTLSVLFVSCGEEQLSRQIFHSSKNTKSRIFVLLHQPPTWLENEVEFLSALNDLAGVFVFSKQLKEFLSSKINTPLYVIKHGVDLDYFSPKENFERFDTDLIVCVGSWLRNHQLMFDLWNRLIQKRPSLKLVIVASKEAYKNDGFQSLLELPNVFYREGLSSDNLLDLYRNAAIHILPLNDGVANNALVESLSAGCPVLVSDVGAVREHLPEGYYGLIQKYDIEAFFNKTFELLDNYELRNQISCDLRRFSLSSLDWNQISCQLLKIIKDS